MSKLPNKLGGLYVGDGKNMYEVLEYGTKYIKNRNSRSFREI